MAKKTNEIPMFKEEPAKEIWDIVAEGLLTSRTKTENGTSSGPHDARQKRTVNQLYIKLARMYINLTARKTFLSSRDVFR